MLLTTEPQMVELMRRHSRAENGCAKMTETRGRGGIGKLCVYSNSRKVCSQVTWMIRGAPRSQISTELVVDPKWQSIVQTPQNASQ